MIFKLLLGLLFAQILSNIRPSYEIIRLNDILYKRSIYFGVLKFCENYKM